MGQAEVHSIITMCIALLSCVSSFYLWVILLIRKRQWRRSNTMTKKYSPPHAGKHTETPIDLPYGENSRITIYTRFLYHMAMYQSILSFALMLTSVNEFTHYKLMDPSCSLSDNVPNTFCLLLRSIITFFLIGSISWYFVITITLCSSLFNHRSITNTECSPIVKYHFMVILISLSVAVMQLVLAHHYEDYGFTQNTTIIPSIIVESFYLTISCVAIVYIRCCHPFYIAGEDGFRMILYLVVFVVLWIFPSLYNMLPIEKRNDNWIYFVKNILINLTGFATMIIWRFSSSFPRRVVDADDIQYERYQTLDDPSDLYRSTDSVQGSHGDTLGHYDVGNNFEDSSTQWFNRHKTTDIPMVSVQKDHLRIWSE